jgi:type 1 fimbria pilin
MANLSKLQKVALAASTFLALISAQVSSNAQAADSATLNISGQITGSTCNITIKDEGGVGAVGTKIINLGNIAAPSASTAGTTFGSTVGAIFSVTAAAGGSTACTLGGNGKWDLALGLFSSQITTISGKGTFLKNSITTANGGTDAIVQLKGAIGTTLPASTATPLVLIPDAGIGGTLMSGQSTPAASSTQSIAISAQFATAAASGPSAGAFSQTIPLIARYN